MTETYAVEGMKCDGCARTVQEAITAAVPSLSVSVSVDRGEVDLAGAHEPSLVASAVQDAGFAWKGRVQGPRDVEAACGQCLLGLPGTGCDLAVRIDGLAYFVDGSGIDDHGDAHAKDGLCNKIRVAKATGEVIGGRFQATSFTLAGS